MDMQSGDFSGAGEKGKEKGEEKKDGRLKANLKSYTPFESKHRLLHSQQILYAYWAQICP